MNSFGSLALVAQYNILIPVAQGGVVIAYAGRGREGENRALSMRRGLTKGMDLRIVFTLPTLETPSESDDANDAEMMPSPQQFDEAESENDPLAHLSEFHHGFFEAREMPSDTEPAMSQEVRSVNGEFIRRSWPILSSRALPAPGWTRGTAKGALPPLKPPPGGLAPP